MLLVNQKNTLKKLWKPQKESINIIKKYISSDSEKFALINMPTGTGKTGIIAYIAHLIPSIGTTLIIVPRKMLREQSYQRIKGDFFKKINLDPSNLKKEVVEIKTTKILEGLSEFKNKIFIITFQLLNFIYKKHPRLLEQLSRNTDITLIDEGHYEPACNWRESIKKINSKKILFTATPFRNDYRPFNIDKNFEYVYSFNEAQSNKIIRTPKWHPRKQINNEKEFVEDILDFLEKNNIKENQKIMIRAETPSQIRSICATLSNYNKSYIAIHETFNNKTPKECKNTPCPKNVGAQFWIHQFKLLEGFDDNRFTVLAIYSPFSNCRQLIQQVGRVLRTNDHTKIQYAHILDHHDGKQIKYWENFIKYDKNILKNKKLLKENPAIDKITYIDKKFRSNLNFDRVNIYTDLHTNLSTNIYLTNTNTNTADLKNSVENEFIEQDIVFYEMISDDDSSAIYLYIKSKNSPLLIESSFIEETLGLTIIKIIGDYIFIHDSLRKSAINNNFHAKKINITKMKKLCSILKNLNFVKLKNSNLDDNAIRTKTLSALNLSKTAPNLNDSYFLCKNAIGHDKDKKPHYIGFERSRLSVQNHKKYNIYQYFSWLEKLSEILNKNTKNSSKLFNRYATYADIPKNPTPKNIILDIDTISKKIYSISSNQSESISIENTCHEIINNKFILKISQSDFEIEISFTIEAGVYELKNEELENSYRIESDHATHGIISYLNKNQSFRIIPESKNYIYAYGNFFNPSIKTGNNFEFINAGFCKLFITSNKIDNCTNEKGNDDLYDADSTEWQKNTLFDAIDKNGKPLKLSSLFKEPDILICDDMATECADFILGNINTHQRLIFIHAKHGKGKTSGIGASQLHDICSQATKNLMYVKRFSNEKPQKSNSWYIKKWNKTNINRIRKCPKKIQENKTVWETLCEIKMNPSSSIEVWIVIGRITSYSKLINELSKPSPNAEAIQAMYLLWATMTEVAAAGATLRVICSA